MSPFSCFPGMESLFSILAQNLSHRSSIVLPAGASLPHLHPFDPLSLRLWFLGGEAVLEELAKVNLGISFVMLIFCWPHPHSWYVYIGHFIVCRLSNRIPSNLTTREICLVVCPVCECVCVCVGGGGGIGYHSARSNNKHGEQPAMFSQCFHSKVVMY